MDKDTLFYKKQTIRCNSRIIDLGSPLVMGILNVTPDSFYDGGKYITPKNISSRIGKMLADGADIIDIGGYSTRPGADAISSEKEIERLSGSLEIIRANFPDAIISIDTFRSEVAAKMISEYQVDIINDISAGNIDPEIIDVVSEHKVAYIAMHMQGVPETMQQNPTYDHIIKDLIEYFSKKVVQLQEKKVSDVIIDPGFGFGKTLDQNYQLLSGLDCFNIFEYPVLVGVSRKSMIYKHLNSSAEDALAGTIACNLVALQKGAKILRVHDVKEAADTISVYNKLNYESEKSINLLHNL